MPLVRLILGPAQVESYKLGRKKENEENILPNYVLLHILIVHNNIIYF